MRLGHITPKHFCVFGCDMCATRRNTSQDVKTFQIVCYSRENWGRTAVLVENGGGFSDRKNCGATPLFPSTGLPGGHSEREPPDPIPNSEVKTFSADGSVGSPHVRVGHCQALESKGHVHPNVAFLFGARGMAYQTKSRSFRSGFFLDAASPMRRYRLLLRRWPRPACNKRGFRAARSAT